MFSRSGITLIELIVVMVIIGISAVMVFPSYNNSTEQARATSAKNNLLAMYSAQQNYNNNNGSYCINSGANATCGDTLAHLNTNLSLNIPDDGTYTYACAAPSATSFTCTATRSGGSGTLVLTLSAPVNVSGSGTANPACNLSSSNWCP